MPLSAEAERAFASESVPDVAVDLLSFESESFGAERFCSDTQPFTSRGQVYMPAPFEDVKLAPSQPGQFPAVDFTIGANDQRVMAALRSIEASPVVRYELVLAGSPDTVQKSIRGLKIETVRMRLGKLAMKLGIFPLFQVIGPRIAYTPDRAPGVHP